MRAAIVREPGCLQVEDIPSPTLGPYDVLCEQTFGSICAATDRHLIRGDLPIPGITYPLILGHESIGRVVERGAKVRHLPIGALVTRTGAPDTGEYKATWGGFVEHGIARDVQAMKADGLPEADWAPFAINQTLPAGTDPAAATMMITWRETHSYLKRLGVPSGGAVLIVGSGGNGFSFAVLARALGAGRVAMLGNPRWRSLAERAAVDAFVDYRDPDATQRLREIEPHGFDLLVDAIGARGGLEAVEPLLKPQAPIGMYGIEALGERMAVLAAMREQGRRVHGPGEYAEAEAHGEVVALVERGTLDAALWFDAKTAPPLDEIASAVATIEAGRSLKAVVKLSG